jgi:ribose transport system permease protein
MNKLNSFAKKNRWTWAAIGSVMMFIVISLISGKFSYMSFTANFTIASYLTICALGQMIVMTTGRGAFDLSIPNMITLSAFLTMGITNGQDKNFLPALAAVILVGALVGLINSILVIRFKITSMIATLAVGYILSTVTSIYNRTFNVLAVSNIMETLTTTRILGIPIVGYIVLLIVAAVALMFRSTSFGRALLALGQNKRAAELAGIKVNLVETLAYVIGAVFAALCGFFLSGRIGGAFLGMGDSYLMDTVGSVVLGGTLASGGYAVTFGTMFGALFLSFVVTAMQIANFSTGMQNIIKGVIIITVLAFGSIKDKSD